MAIYTRNELREIMTKNIPRMSKQQPVLEQEEKELKKQATLAEIARENMRKIQ